MQAAARVEIGRTAGVFWSFFDHAVEGIFLTTPAGRYLMANPRLAAIYGFASPEELIKHFDDIGTQLYVRPHRRDEFIEAVESGEVIGFESEVLRRDGSVIWISENARSVKDHAGRIQYFEGTVIDITDRKRAELLLEKQRAYHHQLFFNSPLAMVLLDADRRVTSCNPAFESLFGYALAEIHESTIREILIPPGLIVEAENYRAAVLSGHTPAKETIRRHKDGRDIPVSMQAFPVLIENEIAGVYYIYQDISERKQYEATITRQAFHDDLTGLPNRTLFQDRLNRALERARRHDSHQFALVLIDLDRFKKINDTLGHLAGDQLLRHVSHILQTSVRSVDTAARLGGDEFGLILEDFQSKHDVLVVLERVQTMLREPFEINGNIVHTSGSMGIVLNTADYTDTVDIMRDADIAMYRAKEQRKTYQIFSSEMQKELLEVLEIESALKGAVHRNELSLHYQPIVSLTTSRLEGFEALLRWNHPVRGSIPPDRFIPIAEDSGLILPLGSWALREACRQLGEWVRNPEMESLVMSVNVSSRQFTQIDLAREVEELLHQNAIPAGRLRLEITESTLMHDMDEVLLVVNKLKTMGVRLAIDDFGTGYSSLSYLKQLPVDCLKIDRSFISGARNLDDSYQILKSVTAMARHMGITVVAEGVEDSYQQALLRELECDNAQGFLYSRPMTADDAEAWLIDKANSR